MSSSRGFGSRTTISDALGQDEGGPVYSNAPSVSSGSSTNSVAARPSSPSVSPCGRPTAPATPRRPAPSPLPAQRTTFSAGPPIAPLVDSPPATHCSQAASRATSPPTAAALTSKLGGCTALGLARNLRRLNQSRSASSRLYAHHLLPLLSRWLAHLIHLAHGRRCSTLPLLDFICRWGSSAGNKMHELRW